MNLDFFFPFLKTILGRLSVASWRQTLVAWEDEEGFPVWESEMISVLFNIISVNITEQNYDNAV